MKSIIYFGCLFLTLSHFGELRAESNQACDNECEKQYKSCKSEQINNSTFGFCDDNLRVCLKDCPYPDNSKR